MSKEITYTIISEDYNPKYTQFTLKENQTYYLLGENGIGKSTLIDLFGGKTRMYSREKDELALDVSFNVSIKSQDLFKQLKKTGDFNESELQDILRGWQEEDLTIKYGSFHDDPDNEQYNQIERELDINLGKKNEKLITQKILDLHEEIQKLIDITSNSIKKIDKYLYTKISRISYLKEDRGWQTRNVVSHKTRILELKKTLEERGKKVFEFIEAEKAKTEDRFSDLKNIWSLGNFHYNLFGIQDTQIMSEQELNKIPEGIEKIESCIEQIHKWIGGKFSYGRKTWVLNRAIAELSISFHEKIDLSQKIIKENFLYDLDERYKNDVTKIAGEFNLKIEDKKRLVNKDGGPLSKGQQILSHAYDETIEQRGYGKVFDEPFIFLDETNIPEMKKYINKISGTKLITTHDKTTIDADEMQNTILMFKDKGGKRCITNFSEFSKIANKFKTTEINGQIQHSLITWAMRYKGDKVLIVEGHTDFAMLKSVVPKGVKIIPIGGALQIKTALNFFGAHFENLFYLMDNDEDGKKAQKEIEGQLGKNKNITDEIFQLGKDNKLVTTEQLLTGKIPKNREEKRFLIKEATENHSEIKTKIRNILKQKFNIK